MENRAAGDLTAKTPAVVGQALHECFRNGGPGPVPRGRDRAASREAYLAIPRFLITCQSRFGTKVKKIKYLDQAALIPGPTMW